MQLYLSTFTPINYLKHRWIEYLHKWCFIYQYAKHLSHLVTMEITNYVVLKTFISMQNYVNHSHSKIIANKNLKLIVPPIPIFSYHVMYISACSNTIANCKMCRFSNKNDSDSLSCTGCMDLFYFDYYGNCSGEWYLKAL